jgi:hypothetical protein
VPAVSLPSTCFNCTQPPPTTNRDSSRPPPHQLG